MLYLGKNYPILTCTYRTSKGITFFLFHELVGLGALEDSWHVHEQIIQSG
jgi:hypothetical protein